MPGAAADPVPLPPPSITTCWRREAVRIEDGLITGLYAVRNPGKLSRLEQDTTLRR